MSRSVKRIPGTKVPRTVSGTSASGVSRNAATGGYAYGAWGGPRKSSGFMYGSRPSSTSFAAGRKTYPKSPGLCVPPADASAFLHRVSSCQCGVTARAMPTRSSAATKASATSQIRRLRALVTAGQ